MAVEALKLARELLIAIKDLTREIRELRREVSSAGIVS